MAERLGRANILLVDDEPDITTTFKTGLEMHGYSVDAFNHPVQALQAFKPKFYDFIFLDVRMPGMTGFDLARALWQKEATARICLMTAFEIYEEEARKVFKDLNGHCFLKKPITPAGLVEHIKMHMARN